MEQVLPPLDTNFITLLIELSNSNWPLIFQCSSGDLLVSEASEKLSSIESMIESSSKSSD